MDELIKQIYKVDLTLNDVDGYEKNRRPVGDSGQSASQQPYLQQ